MLLERRQPEHLVEIAMRQPPKSVAVSNEFLGYCTGDYLALLAAVGGLEEGWTDHHPRGATWVSELKAEAMGGLAVAWMLGTGDESISPWPLGHSAGVGKT